MKYLDALATWGDRLRKQEGRRFYVFDSPEAVKGHIAQVKTITDLKQLQFDIEQSGCNLVEFREGIPGVWALDYADGLGPFRRHIFAVKSLGLVLTKAECDSWSILED